MQASVPNSSPGRVGSSPVGATWHSTGRCWGAGGTFTGRSTSPMGAGGTSSPGAGHSVRRTFQRVEPRARVTNSSPHTAKAQSEGSGRMHASGPTGVLRRGGSQSTPSPQATSFPGLL